VVISPKNDKMKHKFRINQFCTNNEAEYEALIAGLEIALESGARSIEIRGDSELVLNQLTKEYKCVNESLVMYFTLANALLKRFIHVEIRHLPRVANQEVNDLAQMASGYKLSKDQQQEPIEVKNKRSSNDSLVEILVIKNLTDDDWRKPIVTYLENPDGKTCRKVKYRAFSYVLISGDLFKKTP